MRLEVGDLAANPYRDEGAVDDRLRHLRQCGYRDRGVGGRSRYGLDLRDARTRRGVACRGLGVVVGEGPGEELRLDRTRATRSGGATFHAGTWSDAAFTVFRRSMAMVIGPTPPGTGV